jgi:hypothetical protein
VSSDDKQARPSQPPEFKRKFHLYPYQYLTLPLLFLIPILALLGVFGESGDVKDAANTALAVRVEYTSRIRYQLAAPLTVYVTNQTTDVIDRITVRLDHTYIEGFSWASFTPDVTTLTDDAYFVELEAVQPGETRAVAVDLQAERIGNYTGNVIVEARGIEPITVHLETFLFP